MDGSHAERKATGVWWKRVTAGLKTTPYNKPRDTRKRGGISRSKNLCSGMYEHLWRVSTETVLLAHLPMLRLKSGHLSCWHRSGSSCSEKATGSRMELVAGIFDVKATELELFPMVMSHMRSFGYT